MEKKETSDEVKEALQALFQDLSLENELGQYVRDRNKYGGNFVPMIDVADPGGLLDDDSKKEDPPHRR